MLEIKIDTKALERLKQIPKLMIFPEVRLGVQTICMEIIRQAKQTPPCPVDSGRLRASIIGGVVEQTKDRITGMVGSNVIYAPFQEYGTGRRGAETFRGTLPSWYKHGTGGGIRAKMYLGQAFENVMKNRAEMIMRKALSDAWNRNIAKKGA